MISLSNLSHKSKRRKVVGRGPGSGKGKTSCRGIGGCGARSGYRRRYGKEGGQFPLYKKTPYRGFSRGRFVKEVFVLNLDDIQNYFEDGQMVSLETLQAMNIAPRRIDGGLKILGDGMLEKKVKIEANFISASARQKLEEKKISYTIIEMKGFS